MKDASPSATALSSLRDGAASRLHPDGLQSTGAGPVRVQLSRRKGWRMPPNTVSVARPGPWGNPFKVGVDGTAAECVELFKHLLAGRICLTAKASVDLQVFAHSSIASRLDELHGKNLACWCRAGKPCHADVLLELANTPEKG